MVKLTKAQAKLSSVQKSMLSSLRRNDGFARLSNSSFRTYGILHDKGMVTVTIENPVAGFVQITDAGRAEAEIILASDDNYIRCPCGEYPHKHEAACIYCGTATPSTLAALQSKEAGEQ